MNKLRKELSGDISRQRPQKPSSQAGMARAAKAPAFSIKGKRGQKDKFDHAAPTGLSKGLFKGEPKAESNKMITAHQREEKSDSPTFLKPHRLISDQGRIWRDLKTLWGAKAEST